MKQAIILVFDDPEQANRIVSSVQALFAYDDSVEAYVTTSPVTEKVLAIFNEEEDNDAGSLNPADV